MSGRVHYAEVIGDPVAQSKSPAIHKFWLDRLKLSGDYRRTHVPRGTVADFLRERRSDPDWLGCNVTIPHKVDAADLVDQLDEKARAIGAVNCVVSRRSGLFGTNTDIEGVGAGLDGTALEGAKAAIIGGGGASRAATAYLASRGVSELLILVRDPQKAEPLRAIAPAIRVIVAPIDTARDSLEGSAAIINATQLGMTGYAQMSGDLIDGVARHACGVTLFDMVYEPIETRFLATGREAGGTVVDGLTMLIGQAARAFELFFGAKAPPPDERLRSLLIRGRSDPVDLGYNSAPKH